MMNIRPVTPSLGAMVDGVRLSADADDEVIDFVKRALDEHLVLVFKNQDLDARGLRDLSARLGPVFQHHVAENVIFSPGVPEVLEVVKEMDGERLFGDSDWHADVTFTNPEGHITLLQAKMVPPVGGDTCFASTMVAYDALSAGMKKLLESLNGVNSYDGRGVPDHPEHTAVHPVVRTHSRTGRRGLYVNRMFVTRFEGMTARESEPIIDFLDGHISRPEFTCRISWEPGQLVMWDNRFTLHLPVNDFTGYRRRLLRCTTLDTKI